MKQIKEQLKEVGINAHTAGAEKVNGEGILPASLQKFKDVESLCKAYNSLESEFTKRCQRIKELEGKLEKLSVPSSNDENDLKKAKTDPSENSDESAANCCDNNGFEKKKAAEIITEKALRGTEIAKEKTVDNGTIAPLIADDKGDSQGTMDISAMNGEGSKADFCSEESKTAKACDKTVEYGNIVKPVVDAADTTAEKAASSDGREETASGKIVGEVMKFFKDYPESTAHMGELEALCRGDYSLSSLQRAYIEILKKGEARKDPPAREADGVSEAVKLMVIKDYLNSLRQKGGPALMGGNGVIPMTPPVRPKNIAEAGALAQNIIKIK